ncbi:MAG: sugar transferase [Caldicoprobacterales bacterium]
MADIGNGGRALLKDWYDLPDIMKNNYVYKYYEILRKKRVSLYAKRIFDFIVALFMLIVSFPLFILISVLIKIDSKGPVFFRQVRVTQYGRQFRIFKFRTMVNNAHKIGTHITTKNDNRITRVGKFLRKYRLDEIPQLINIVLGDMTFVGTRPEVVRYVERYTDEMMATLLLPAGVTSEASIQYKDEELLLSTADDVDEMYVNYILPMKMEYNLKSIEEFSFLNDIKTMIRTVMAVIKKDENKLISIETPKKDLSEVNI